MAGKPNTYQDDIKYEINIDKVYSDFIGNIDAIRSPVNINKEENFKLLNNTITKDIFTGGATSGFLTPENSPQESRCHAFFRIIGFPVVSADKKIYNPGHDIIIEEGRSVTDDEKISIINNPLPGFVGLSSERERRFKYYLKIFANKANGLGGVYALSLVNFRNFSSVFEKNSDSIENPFTIFNQSYKIKSDSLVGSNRIFLSEYVDAQNVIQGKYLAGGDERYHIIKPFIVDPVIDFTAPSSKRIAVPFVRSDIQLKIDDTKSVDKPLIEKIIRERFSVENEKSKSGTLVQATIDQIKNILVIKDENIIKTISSGNIYGINEAKKITRITEAIRAMMLELYKAKLVIREAQSKYYWLPIPSTTGPEGGFSIHPVFPHCYDNVYNNKFTTVADVGILRSQYMENLSSISQEAAKLNAVPDPGGYGLKAFINTFDESSSDALGNTNKKDLDKRLREREYCLNNAGQALRTIEIITGEFSGLGLIDIMIIIAGLYLMNANNLLGFLDNDAYKRARSFIKSLPEENPSDITSALEDLTSKVIFLYSIAQKVSESFDKTSKDQ